MKQIRSLLGIVAMAAATVGCQHTQFHQLAGTPNWTPDPPHAQALATEENSGNGIEVGKPKIYDDASLRMMLDGIRAKLAGMSGLDQASLIASLGNISGATISQTQIGFQASGPGLPTVATTNTGGTNSTTTNSNLPTGNTTVPDSVNVATQPTAQSVVTSSPPPTAAPTTPAGLAFTPPAAVAPSSLDLLNQQMQLSYEMASLELLLEGALSDRYIAGQRFVKPRVTLGFPISLRAPAPARDAVAVVEVEIESMPQTLSDEAPTLTALLPREKTYNVAAMTDRTTSIGAGAVIGMIGLSGSFTHGSKALYLVQDQDTIALQRPPDPSHPRLASFLWEFHPVLGEHYVRNGLKQTFVQVALPTLGSVGCFGTIKVRTYWRHFDQKTGTSGSVIAESVLASNANFPIPSFDLTPSVGTINYQDLGDGTVMVSIKAESAAYLAGTYVRLGPTRYDVGKNLTIEDTFIKFVAPIAALARWKPYIVARDGAQADIALYPTPLPVLGACQSPQAARPPAPTPTPPLVGRPVGCERLEITSLAATPLSETDSRVRVAISTSILERFQSQLLLEIGGKVYGLRDVPVKRESGPVITAVVPTASLVSNPDIRVFRPFWNDAQIGNQFVGCGYDVKRITEFDQDSATEHLVLVSVAANGDAVYVLYGNGLDNARILVPTSGATLAPVDSVAPTRLRLLTMTKGALDTTKKIVLQKSDGERPLVIDVPDTKAMPPKVTVDSPVIQNTDELNLSAEHAGDIASVTMGKTTLKWKSVDDSSIRLLNLKADGVTNEQKSQTLTVQYKNGVKVTVNFEVVVARIGVKQN
ncbi:MAG: hypothetical protein ABSG03_36490 [Bryobacteraceae bacterium]|jgi:hypothetical protein